MAKGITQNFNDGQPKAGSGLEDQSVADLMEQARAATNKGDFVLSNALISQSEASCAQDLAGLIKAKCERLELRAGIASLASDYKKSASLYDQAAALCRDIDKGASLAYAKKAADTLTKQNQLALDVAGKDLSLQ